MNSAARVLTQSVVSSRHPVVAYVRDWVHSSVMLMLIAVVISALSVIYVANNTRNLQAELHRVSIEREQLHIQAQQLLLEKGTWIMQSRVQQTALHRLNMIVPDRKSIILLNDTSR